MQIIPSNLFPKRDKASLREFLHGCRETARANNHFQIASISLEVRHIAPLAVLQSIYEPDELHFYVERPSADEALAGAEAVVSATFEGPERFERVNEFAEEVLRHTVAVGDLDRPFAGPHFFLALAFADRVGPGGVFPAATVFLPQWQVSRSGGRHGAVANVRIDPDSDLEPLVERVWAAYGKFSAFDYAEDAEASAATPGAIRRSELGAASYANAVRRALREIDSGAYEKIVLARAVQLDSERPWRPLSELHRLRERFGGCFTFSFGGGGGRSFIGATPERLLRIEAGRLQTEAIAGSAPRGANAAADASHASKLLESEKDNREHACVRDSILRQLRAAGVRAEAEEKPRLLPLRNVQHLQSAIRGDVGTSVPILDIVRALHPTPAVGGMPREPAVARIPGLEETERGLFAGVVGWFNHLNEGEMVVGIRSALIDGCRARLHAGAGIVAGSDPEKEKAETELKLRALLDVLTRHGDRE